jgi:transcriptional regulator with XRE-family HTH domain
MRIAVEKVRNLCRKKGITIHAMLRHAGVSRNAYYTLARKSSVLPRSLTAVSRCLDVPPSDLLANDAAVRREMQVLMGKVTAVAARYPDVDRENVRHTLLLLRERPIERLRRALIRGQRPHIRKR